MNLGQLRKLIKDLPDSTEILRPGSDHSYRRADAYASTVLVLDGHYSEDHGDGVTPEGPDLGRRVKALLIN